MGKLTLIILIFISFHSVSQSYDSLYFELKETKVNFKDELGRKQGDWCHYKVKLCKNDSSVFKLEPNQIILSRISEGEYLNNQKVGTWLYYYDDYNPCHKGEHQISTCIIKTENYDSNNIEISGNIGIYGRNTFSIFMNRDSSFFQSIIYT
jgi:hypothetical protein